MPASRTYTSRHFRDIAALLAAERTEHSASPVLNRITAAFTALYTEDSVRTGSKPPYIFDPVLFRTVALGQESVSARPRRGRAVARGPGQETSNEDTCMSEYGEDWTAA